MPRALLALVTVALLGAAVATWVGREPASAQGQLGARLAATGDVARFGFDHRAGGTGVLDCVLPNRQISGTVDFEAGAAILRAAAGAEVARKGVDQAWLHRDLFAGEVVPTTWLHLELPASGDRRAELTTALGTELAGYVLAEGLPATGRATAQAALDAAQRVDVLPSERFDGGRRDGYRITVAQDRFADLASSEERGARSVTDVHPPTVDVWLDERDRVRRIVVVPARRPGARDRTSGGWAIDYWEAAPRIDDRPPRSVTEIAEIEPAQLRARQPAGGCELPL
ncbi:MAG: hypothetical protein ACLGHT_04220 [Acidimicrobiia bacterium]